MNMFARFDENPAMTLRVIKETKRYRRTDGQRENSIPPTNKVCGGIIKSCKSNMLKSISMAIQSDMAVFSMKTLIRWVSAWPDQS